MFFTCGSCNVIYDYPIIGTTASDVIQEVRVSMLNLVEKMNTCFITTGTGFTWTPNQTVKASIVVNIAKILLCIETSANSYCKTSAAFTW